MCVTHCILEHAFNELILEDDQMKSLSHMGQILTFISFIRIECLNTASFS